RSDGGNAQTRHLQQVACDRFPLAALLCSDSGISAREIEKGKYRAVEFFRNPHGAQRLTVAFRLRAAKLASDTFFQRAALQVGDHQDGLAMKESHPASHR